MVGWLLLIEPRPVWKGGKGLFGRDTFSLGVNGFWLPKTNGGSKTHTGGKGDRTSHEEKF